LLISKARGEALIAAYNREVVDVVEVSVLPVTVPTYVVGQAAGKQLIAAIEEVGVMSARNGIKEGSPASAPIIRNSFHVPIIQFPIVLARISVRPLKTYRVTDTTSMPHLTATTTTPPSNNNTPR
jgi:hypothetical protein